MIATAFKTISAILVASASLGWLAGCKQKTAKEGANYTQVKSEDVAMNAAISQAKNSAAQFVKALHEAKPGTGSFFVKKPYRASGGGAEHMWIEVASEEGGVLKGRVSNEAEETKEVRMGQEVTLSLSEISDWKYQDGKKLVGGFTIRYFIEKMPAEERAAFLKQAGFDL